MEKQNASDTEKTPEFADARVLDDLTGVDRQLMEGVSKFLRTHVLKVDFSEEQRGGGGLGGGGIGGGGGFGNKGGIGGKNKIKRKYSVQLLFNEHSQSPSISPPKNKIKLKIMPTNLIVD